MKMGVVDNMLGEEKKYAKKYESKAKKFKRFNQYLEDAQNEEKYGPERQPFSEDTYPKSEWD